VARPAFQHQGPASNCVIDNKPLGWVSCTAYSMAMLIDAATAGARRPKGCKVRRLVRPLDTEAGLNLRQVADVADDVYDVEVAVRTGGNAISTEGAIARIERGRGFVLQGNNTAWNMGGANHAVYVHEVRGGDVGAPKEALVYDPQRQQARWIPWKKVLAFGAELRLNESGTRKLGPGRLYAGFMPRPAAGVAAATPAGDGVVLTFGATRLPHRDRTLVDPPAGRRINVRSTPLSLAHATVVETLGKGARFVAFQERRGGALPPGAGSRHWYGNRDGTEWVHVSGLKHIGGEADAGLGPGSVGDDPLALPSDTVGEPPGDAELPLDITDDDLAPDRPHPAEITSTSDPDPLDIDGDFPGQPLTDAEIDALPVEEDEP
jgi:hypothetical protein